MIGQTLGHYRIVEKIGAGGMGVVYRARDEQLDRDVALKVLPSGVLADEAARKRFRKEALALAKLNHPHIEAVYEFGTQDGVDFLVMEYAPGATLAERLVAGALPEKEVLVVGAQIAAALEEAHEHGVVHRDLKPGNVVVTPKGQAKVLDFGLAKLLRPESEIATTDVLSSTAAVAGTLPYMSPEQLRGTPADARSDIYAAGAVLYEMATGKRPFPEGVATALVDDILHKPPPPPGRLKHDLSPRLEEIILKCLEKDPENRYQSAKELSVDLRRIGSSAPLSSAVAPALAPTRQSVPTWALRAVVALAVISVAGYFAWHRLGPRATPPSGKIMLAVLPFGNLSADPAQEYFSDGLTEEMIAQLGGLQPQRLGVIARTSAMNYKNTKKDISQIGRELGVHYVLEGSVRRASDRVRITAQLIQVDDQTHLWAENYERQAVDVFAVQSDVARRIAESLALELLPAQRERLAAPRAVNPQVHELYLKGRYHANKLTEEGTSKGIEYFQQALGIAPDYALAYAGMAEAYYATSNIQKRPREVMPKAEAAAKKALAIDDTLAEAHTSLALVHAFYNWDWSAADREFQRALELNPGYARGHEWYGVYLATTGRVEEGAQELRRARELDPLSLSAGFYSMLPFYFARQSDRQIEQIRKVQEMDPNFYFVPWGLGMGHALKGEYPQAIAELRKAQQMDDSPGILADLARVYALSGNRTEALKLLDELKKQAKRRYVAPTYFASVYGALGEKDKAFDWLGKAFEERDENMTWLKVDPVLDPLRSDPRFSDLLRRMNFPP